LVTLNDPVYAEASEALAGRMMTASANLDERIQCGARLVLSRDLSENELATVRRLYAKVSGTPEGARLVRTSAEMKDNSRKNRLAMTAVASVLLNLDAALTR
jgi:hypothetical protein